MEIGNCKFCSLKVIGGKNFKICRANWIENISFLEKSFQALSCFIYVQCFFFLSFCLTFLFFSIFSDVLEGIGVNRKCFGFRVSLRGFFFFVSLVFIFIQYFFVDCFIFRLSDSSYEVRGVMRQFFFLIFSIKYVYDYLEIRIQFVVQILE